jgi:hypothetical protein
MSDDSGYRPNYICNDGGEIGITSADILDNFDNGASSPIAAVVASKIDSKISPKVVNKITKSKVTYLDKSMGLVKHIKNPGLIAKGCGVLVKTFGIISMATLGLAITNNFVNYKHPFGRTLADLGCFGLAFGIGGAILLGAGVIIVGAGAAALKTG